MGRSFDASYYKPMIGGEFKTIQETVQALGHEERVFDILKIDCEDCELYTFKDWLQFDF
jgi:hypothetical protein